MKSTIVLGFEDGRIHRITFKENILGIRTADYKDDDNIKNYENLVIKCKKLSEGASIILKKSRKTDGSANVYRFPVVVLFPMNFTSGESVSFVDLRWGEYQSAKIFEL
jgi:hypothetical protein